MSARKNAKFLLSEKEQNELLVSLKQRKIKLKDFADSMCISYAALRDMITDVRMIRIYRELFELREEVNELREFRDKMRSVVSEK